MNFHCIPPFSTASLKYHIICMHFYILCLVKFYGIKKNRIVSYNFNTAEVFQWKQDYSGNQLSGTGAEAKLLWGELMY